MTRRSCRLPWRDPSAPSPRPSDSYVRGDRRPVNDPTQLCHGVVMCFFDRGQDGIFGLAGFDARPWSLADAALRLAGGMEGTAEPIMIVFVLGSTFRNEAAHLNDVGPRKCVK